MLQIPLSAMIQILRSATVEDNPFSVDEETNAVLGEKFVAMAHAVADFVDTGKDAIGYEQTRTMLEDMVHTFPVDEHQKDPFEALQEALLKAMGEAPDAFTTEADGPEGAPKE